MSHSVPSGTSHNLSSRLHEHWRLYLGEGLFLMILGAGAVALPSLASVASAYYLGFLFLAGGLVGLIGSVMTRHGPGFLWSLLSAVVAIVAGCLLVGWPLSGVVSLTAILAVFLVADGLVTMLIALDHRRQLSVRWAWLFLNGVLDLFLAGLILTALRSSSFWVLGVIVGIDLLFGGSALVVLAFAARKS